MKQLQVFIHRIWYGYIPYPSNTRSNLIARLAKFKANYIILLPSIIIIMQDSQTLNTYKCL